MSANSTAEELITKEGTTNPARNGFISFNDDEMSLYLRKINSIPSLTSEEEKEVALAPKLGRPPKKKRANQRKTVMLKCQECGKFFEVPHYDKDKRKFCSRTCGSRNQNRKRMTRRIVTKNC